MSMDNRIYRVRHDWLHTQDLETGAVGVRFKGETLDAGRNRHKKALRELQKKLGKNHEVVRAMREAEKSVRRSSFADKLETQRV